MSLISSVFIATSLDGFIARKDGSIDWLDDANKMVPRGTDLGYEAFMKGIDILIMGRNSYEKVRSFGFWPYGDKPVIVLTSRELHIPEDLVGTVSSSSETPRELSERLAIEGFQRAYIDGGYTIQQFLNDGLIDDITITTIPVILGDGISLFEKTNKDILLKHTNTKSYEFGFVQTSYNVINNS